MKIFCIGRNYREHAKELQHPISANPIVFMKGENALLNGTTFRIPKFSNDIHYELEVVIRISKTGKYIPQKEASSFYKEIALGIDFTARTLQKELQLKGLPWELAKSFDDSALLSPFFQKENFNIHNLNFSLQKNRNIVQEDTTAHMLFSFDFLIAFLSEYFTLQSGDLIFTGTPKGVGKIAPNDRLEAFLEGKKVLSFEVK